MDNVGRAMRKAHHLIGLQKSVLTWKISNDKDIGDILQLLLINSC